MKLDGVIGGSLTVSASRPLSNRRRIETLRLDLLHHVHYTPQDRFPIEEGLKLSSIARCTSIPYPQDRFPIEEGLKRMLPGLLPGYVLPQDRFPIEEGLKLHIKTPKLIPYVFPQDRFPIEEGLKHNFNSGVYEIRLRLKTAFQ